ncbi:MAG: PAS domain-containing protein [Nitrospirales bacterium]|nr:PAS domain-containing protein [Nitrospirales bacterium]
MESTSEARYRLAVRAAHGIIWDWDISKGKVLWGESIRSVLGYTADEDGHIVADDSGWWRDKIHPDDCERVVKGLEVCIGSVGKAVWSSEYQFRRADGTYACMLDKGCIQRDKDGAAIRMVGSMLDITQVKEQERAIRKLNEELQARISELEKFEEVVVGRELKMIQLEKEIERFRRLAAER